MIMSMRPMILALAFCASLPPHLHAAQPIRGYVYHDLNGNGRHDPGEPGLPNIPITDGVQFVKTAPDGTYEISPAPDPGLVLGGTAAISASFPSGYWPSSPWYINLDSLKPDGAADFGLQPRKQELPFLFVHGTDAHVPRAGKAKFQNFRADMEVLKTRLAFGILTGDLTDGSDCHTYDQAREEYGFLGEQIHDFPIPLFCLPGNHDLSGVNATPAWDPSLPQGFSFFTRVAGPLRWSFNYADIHFVGVDFAHPVNGKWGWGTSSNGVAWLDRDLDNVPAGRRIFLFVHAPLDTNGLAQVVRRHSVTQIFHGHDHQDQASLFAGVPALSGGSLSQVFEDKDRATGYRLVRVTTNGLETFYRPSGEPHGISLDEPRTPNAYAAGQRVSGKVWDPELALKKLWLGNGPQSQAVALETGSLWRPFQTQLSPALTNGNITNFTVNVADGTFTWQTTPFQNGVVTQFLFALDAELPPGAIVKTDAEAQWTPAKTLRITTGHQERWPGITLKIPTALGDLSTRLLLATTVKNLDVREITVYGRLDNAGADGAKNCLNANLTLKPGESGTLRWLLNPTPWRLADGPNLIGMRAAPGKSENFDAARVTQLLIFQHEPKTDASFEIGPLVLSGQVWNLPSATFFPFIDELGQFIHADWTGKTRSAEDLVAQKRLEEKDMKDHAAPTDWDQYGGWSEGPQLSATGYFRAEKREGKWWLVTPEGHLFWSFGIDCVNQGESTPITDREQYFRGLPKPEEPLGRYYGTGSWAPLGYYEKHTPYKTYDFAQANLERKYGENWRAQASEMAHRRLRSWGLNTIGNWSDERLCRLRHTPYTATLSIGARIIEGSEGYWGKFADVFDPSFREAVRKNMAYHAATAAQDPWCLGFFVDNELSWGNETSLAEAALLSPAEQPAKIEFLKDLQSKYGAIEKLNSAWASQYESWDALGKSREKPDSEKAKTDLQAFYSKLAETYFQTVREEVKRVAPNHLYLGCRFAWINDRALRAAAKYADVLSCNSYEYNVSRISPPADIDRPFIIGEFHFGALDRGLFHTGLKSALNQEDRAGKFSAYIQSALQHPLVVGAHWFQYRDQPTTGRGDGENYQIGFVDVCDRPYAEIVRASRNIGEHLYDTRSSDAPRK
jgi:hypothetical protein